MSEDIVEVKGSDVVSDVSDGGADGKGFWLLFHLFAFRAQLIAKCDGKLIKREQVAAFLENLVKAMNYHGFGFTPVPETLRSSIRWIVDEKRGLHSLSAQDDNRISIFRRDYGGRPENICDHPRLALSNFLRELAVMVRESASLGGIRAYIGRRREEYPQVDYTQLLSQIRLFSLLEEVEFREEMGARGTVVLIAAACCKSVFNELDLKQFDGLEEVVEDPLDCCK
jgi:hypothetical protein